MPTCALRSQKLNPENIDGDASVIRGVKVALCGHLASFDSPSGVKQITVTEGHISALKDHAGNRTIPVHWTHDYLSENRDRLHAKVGALKDFRLDSSKNLVADFHVAPTQYRDTIFWNAANDPEGMMLSAVFGYGEKDPNCLPVSFDAADLVAEGAATTALFSKTQNQVNDEIDMTPDELKKLMADTVKDTVTATLAAAKPNKDETETAALAAAEKEAGVTEADRKAEDKQFPAATASSMAIHRATMRQARELATLAKTQALETIGSQGFIVTGGNGGTGDDSIPAKFEKAVTAQMAAGCKSRGEAKFRIGKDNPDLYAKWSELRDKGLLAKV